MTADPAPEDALPAPGPARLPTVAEIRRALDAIADLLEPAAWEQLLHAAGLDDPTGSDRGDAARADLDRLLATMQAAWDPLIEMTAREFLVRVEAYDRARRT